MVIAVFSAATSPAENDISSRRRSITVCKRRAPIFSVRSLTCHAISASRLMPSLPKDISRPSVSATPDTVQSTTHPALARYVRNRRGSARSIPRVSANAPAIQESSRGRFCQMECARCHKKNMVCFYHAVFGGNRAALN